MIYGLTQEKIKGILEKYKTKRDLFNWCEEYNKFVDECVLYCVSSEWDYMLKKSYEDDESPISYEELETNEFNEEQALYMIEKEIPTDEESIKDFLEEVNDYLRKDFKNTQEFKEYLKELDDDDFDDLTNISFFTHLDQDDFRTPIEVYEWWLISDPLKYRLEKQEQIFLNGAWGRQTTGQSIKLDYCVMQSFIELLGDLQAR